CRGFGGQGTQAGEVRQTEAEQGQAADTQQLTPRLAVDGEHAAPLPRSKALARGLYPLPPVRQAPLHPRGGRGRGEVFRIETAADPFQQFVVPLVVRVLDGFDEVRVAPDAADVFRRTGPFALQADRIPRSRLGPLDALEENLVLPRVAEIVLVAEPEPLAV